MSTHRKPPSRRAPLYTALVVALAVFAVIIGFGGTSKDSSPTARSSSPPTSSATPSQVPSPTAARSRATPTASSKAPQRTPSLSPKPKPKPTSTGLGTTDGSLSGLSQRVKAQPIRIRIPALGVDAPVIAVGVNVAGELAVPANVVQAAWYQGGSAPGQRGTAIIAAHVDFRGALGLFNKLRTLSRGAVIEITDASGNVRQFRVSSGQLAPKSDPTTVRELAAASAAPGRPRLALITCGGDLNYAKHSYYDNFVLLADL